MSNLTISVDNELIKRARVRAIRQGTSLSAKVREFLQRYVDESDEALDQKRVAAAARLMTAIDGATAQTQRAAKAAGAKGRRRSLREELYEDDFRARDRRAAKTATGK